jgi:hypothetical protein
VHPLGELSGELRGEEDDDEFEEDDADRDGHTADPARRLYPA